MKKHNHKDAEKHDRCRCLICGKVIVRGKRLSRKSKSKGCFGKQG